MNADLTSLLNQVHEDLCQASDALTDGLPERCAPPLHRAAAQLRDFCERRYAGEPPSPEVVKKAEAVRSRFLAVQALLRQASVYYQSLGGQFAPGQLGYSASRIPDLPGYLGDTADAM